MKSNDSWKRAITISGCLVLLLEIFRWPLVSVLTVFFEPMLEIAATLTLLGVGTGTLVHAIRARGTLGKRAWHPLMYFAFFAIIAIAVPFNTLYLKANFRFFRNRRTIAAQTLLAGPEGYRENAEGRGNLVSLPLSQQGLSDDGEVIVDHRDGKSFILFFTFRGVLDRFSGFVYSPSDTAPAKDEFLGDGIEIYRISPCWFWYAS